MAEPINTAAVPTLQNTLPPELDASIHQAAAGLPPEAVQQALGVYGAFTPTLGEQEALRAGMTAPGGATTLAQQAQAAYQQAAAAPPPQVSGARQGLNELLGSVASILSGNQAYRETASQRLQKEQQALLDSRVQNLTSLKNLYEQRAEAAKTMGNAILEEENRIKKERLDKSLETINKARAHQYAMEEAAGKQRADEVATKRMQNSAVNTLIDNYRQDADVKSYRVIARALRNARNQAGANDTTGDIALINAFAKANDERTGVRTEEFRVYEKAAGWISDKLNLPQRLTGKGLLPQWVRNRIIQEMTNFEREARVDYDKAYNVAMAQGRALDIPEETVKSLLIQYGDSETPADTTGGDKKKTTVASLKTRKGKP